MEQSIMATIHSIWEYRLIIEESTYSRDRSLAIVSGLMVHFDISTGMMSGHEASPRGSTTTKVISDRAEDDKGWCCLSSQLHTDNTASTIG